MLGWLPIRRKLFLCFDICWLVIFWQGLIISCHSQKWNVLYTDILYKLTVSEANWRESLKSESFIEKFLYLNRHLFLICFPYLEKVFSLNWHHLF